MSRGPRAARVQVSLNGVDWTVSRRSFTYYNYDQLHISLFEPEGGPTAGGTSITIHGSSFMYTQHLRCTWDGNTDRANKVHGLPLLLPPPPPPPPTYS